MQPCKMWWTCIFWSNVQKNISLAHIHQLHLTHIFGLLFFNQYACLNVSFRKISKVFISFLATKNMMLVSFLKIFALKFLSYNTFIFSFMVITKMNFHFRRIFDFSYISQDSSKKKKEP